MKKFTFLIAGLLAFSTLAGAQGNEKVKEAYGFKDIVRLGCTPVKSQDNAGTCWSWSGNSFLESEMIRMGKPAVEISPLFTVWNCYDQKAVNYVRLHGVANFSQGGSFADVIWSLKTYGTVPLEVYKGINYGEKVHAHSELEALLKSYVDVIIQKKNGRLTTAWHRGFDAILNEYLGAKPEKFEYKGKEYTPQTFAKDFCGLDADNYICLTSFTHHPFYSKFALEVPDNWINGLNYNVPIEELVDICDKALDNGYTVAWATDCSENGFTRTGMAVTPDSEIKLTKDNEEAKWVKNLPKAEMAVELAKGPMKQKEITQEMRQQEFDTYLTTDDHGMHIIGKAVDKNGTKYFIVKNSWGSKSGFEGYWYASYEFFAHKTMNIMIHKDALSKNMKKKLDID